MRYNHNMRVGIDISQIIHKGGVPNYTKNLVTNLEDIKDLELIPFFSSMRQKYSGDIKGVKSFKMPPTLFEIFFNQLRIVPIEKFIGEVDIFHSSDWIQPPTKARKVTTYHDLVPLKYPQWSHPKIVEVNKRRLKLVEKEIDMVIAVSESTKKDLLEISNIPEEKIVVIYEGVEQRFFKKNSPKEIEEFKKKYNLPQAFVLAIGGVGERRNLKRVKEASKDYNLVITGETIPWISDEEMPLLYSSAKVLLYPSLYEGFGLPILEAMASSIPVVTSNISSMVEIAEDNAMLVDPGDIKDIKKNLEIIMKDEQIRKDMIGNGLHQASRFRWDNTAHETYEVYKRLLK